MREHALLFAAALAAVTFVAAPSEAMTCRQRIVQQGDTSGRALELCGEPAEIIQQTVTRSRVIQRQLPDGTIISDTISVTVPIELWTYDFGPQRFMVRLVIEDGRIVSEETLGYGTAGNSPR
ncbi:MAG: DUF2845 domain-containing protein [Sandaracinaceae bacterium]|nr:DUF2845 domain-containing protein [Sandaracinaceae bacterium]